MLRGLLVAASIMHQNSVTQHWHNASEKNSVEEDEAFSAHIETLSQVTGCWNGNIFFLLAEPLRFVILRRSVDNGASKK